MSWRPSPDILDACGGLPSGFEPIVTPDVEAQEVAAESSFNQTEAAMSTDPEPTPPSEPLVMERDYSVFTRTTRQSGARQRPSDETTVFTKEQIFAIRTGQPLDWEGDSSAASGDTDNSAPVLSSSPAEPNPSQTHQVPGAANAAEQVESTKTTESARRRTRYLPSRKVAVITGALLLLPLARGSFNPEAQDVLPITNSEQGEQSSSNLTKSDPGNSESQSLIDSLMNPILTPVEPVRFAVPSSISVGDNEGCTDVITPVVTSTLFRKDNTEKTAESGPSYIKATREGKRYYIALPKGGVVYELGACGLKDIPVSATDGELTAENIQRQKASVDTTGLTSSGERVTPQNSLRLVGLDEYFRDVNTSTPEGLNAEVCSTVTKGKYPDCKTVTSLDAAQQERLLSSALYTIGKIVAQQCTDETTRALKSTIRKSLKDSVISQEIGGVTRSDVTVSFTGQEPGQYLESEVADRLTAGIGTADEVDAIFPDISSNLTVYGCNKA